MDANRYATPVLISSAAVVMLAASITARPGVGSWILPAASAAGSSEGQRLFNHETFGGNGRTCRTCHSDDDGTIDAGEVAERLTQDPSDPLFLHDGLGKALHAFAQGGPAPTLPEGRTASEKRGREFFVDAPWNPPSKKGACATCHSGPMLNIANQFTTDSTGAPPGWRAFDLLVSSRNLMNNPVRAFAVTDRWA